MNGKLILVTGATGRQGGAVVRHALRRGFKVRAIARNPASPKARALATAGVEVVPGDMEDPSSLKPALQGVYGVFSVQNFWERASAVRAIHPGLISFETFLKASR